MRKQVSPFHYNSTTDVNQFKLAHQALGIPFRILSASEINMDAVALCLMNHRNAFDHVFLGIEDQLANKPCITCRDSSSCDALSGETEVDLLVTGSPCNPFSQQSSKRFANGHVKGHDLFDVTMKSVLSSYEKFNPKVGVMEQVKGFEMPFEKNGSETPLDRQGWVRDGCW